MRELVVLRGIPGCITGDAIIRGHWASRAESGRRNTGVMLEHIFKHQHGIAFKGSCQTKSTIFIARCYNEETGLIEDTPISSVYSGKKQCYIVKTENQSIEVTEEHQFLTENGWKKCKDLQKNDVLYIYPTKKSGGGCLRTEKRKTKKNSDAVCIKYHPTGTKKIINGYVYYQKFKYVLEFEANMNNMSYKQYIQALNNKTSGLYYVPKGMHLHHIDRDRNNNSIENIKILTSSEHARLHWLEDRISNTSKPVKEKIVSINISQIKDVYDITCEKHHNFFANNFLVHNCGKSTFLERNKLQIYTLSPDTIRLMVAGTKKLPNLVSEIFAKEQISSDEDKYVWKIMNEMLVKRMEKGLFTVIDATHTKESYINDYKKLCDAYRYRLIVVEFKVEPEDAMYRNLMRPGYKVVSESVIKRMYDKMQNPLSEANKKYITTPQEFEKMLHSPHTYDLNQFERIHIVGDIHSCFTALKQDLEENNVLLEDGTIDPHCALILTGDYIDRGIEPVETVNFLYSIKDLPNVYMLLGNHELHIEKLMRNKNDTSCIGYARETIRTLKTLGEEGCSKLRQIVRKCRTHMIVNFDLDTYYITHGGIPSPIMKLTDYSANELICGVGDYADAQAVDNMFTAVSAGSDISIHAHRNNGEKCDIHSSEKTYNLCGDVEHGGFLRSLTIIKNSHD